MGSKGFSNAAKPCFGKKWTLSGLNLTPDSKISGVAYPGGRVVDFSEQTGIYYLYNGDQIVHHGRTVEALGKSLYGHTTDQLAGKWDHFTWFGFRPVNENGALGPLPAGFSMDCYLGFLQAVLIELFDPVFNTKQDIADVRLISYTQQA